MYWKYKYDFSKLLEQYGDGWKRLLSVTPSGRSVGLVEQGVHGNKVLKIVTGWVYNSTEYSWRAGWVQYEVEDIFKGSDIFAVEFAIKVENVGGGRGGSHEMYIANGKEYIHLNFFNNRVELQPTGVIVPLKHNRFNTIRIVKGTCGKLHVYLNSLKLFSRNLLGETEDNVFRIRSEGETTVYLDKLYIHDGDKQCKLVRVDFPNRKGFKFPELEPDPNDGEGIVPCGTTTSSGGQGVTRTIHNLGSTPGRVVIEYRMGGAYPDKLEVFQGGYLLIDTRTVPGNTTEQYRDEDGSTKIESGFVLGEGTLEFNYNPAGGDVEVVVKGNSSSFTSWTYTVNCPV